MPNMPVIPAKDFLRLLIKFGCIHISTVGSHHKVENPVNGLRSVIPVHGSRDLSKVFSKEILRQLGIDPNEFIKFIDSN